MTCPPIITGDEFLERTLTHIDCQAQLIGSYGYQALGQPGSTVSLVVASLLTIFIALFGIRLLFGPQPGARDAVFDVIRVGLVLTLAFSWPAFRTVVYDVTLKAPGEIASVIQASSGNGGSRDFSERLQATDNSIVALTTLGAGRNAGTIVESEGQNSSFRGSAVDDDTGYAGARVLYLASVIGTLGLLRIGAGLLLALAPLAAGLYFFAQSRGIFAGWLKGLVFTVAGSIGVSIVLSVQLALIEPWLADALNVRRLGYATPAAPTELLAIMLAFVIVQVAILWLLAKVTFYRGWVTLPDLPEQMRPWERQRATADLPSQSLERPVLRAERISNSIQSSVRRERLISAQSHSRATEAGVQSGQSQNHTHANAPRLGSSYRRRGLRSSRASLLRDQQS
ncbi:MAG: type IV secretion system protein [Erythrobacter sp.]|uniref:type IV secretion system protein n=1 Tax=Erythrobacter sp. TaxID=1042 RepID=UPI0032670CFA